MIQQIHFKKSNFNNFITFLNRIERIFFVPFLYIIFEVKKN